MAVTENAAHLVIAATNNTDLVHDHGALNAGDTDQDRETVARRGRLTTERGRDLVLVTDDAGEAALPTSGLR